MCSYEKVLSNCLPQYAQMIMTGQPVDLRSQQWLQTLARASHRWGRPWQTENVNYCRYVGRKWSNQEWYWQGQERSIGTGGATFIYIRSGHHSLLFSITSTGIHRQWINVPPFLCYCVTYWSPYSASASINRGNKTKPSSLSGELWPALGQDVCAFTHTSQCMYVCVCW